MCFVGRQQLAEVQHGMLWTITSGGKIFSMSSLIILTNCLLGQYTYRVAWEQVFVNFKEGKSLCIPLSMLSSRPSLPLHGCLRHLEKPTAPVSLILGHE